MYCSNNDLFRKQTKAIKRKSSTENHQMKSCFQPELSARIIT